MKQLSMPVTQLSIATLIALATPLLAIAKESSDHAHHHDSHEEIEEIIVQATRSRRRLQDEPTRVEVLAGEEIEEKLLMRPGNISMMLNETGGLRVQLTSAALGSANVRIHGLRGRYTQLLADGLPLYGGQASSLGLLQVPPSDLGQVEIIKGSASALYGGQAMGGVINLVSKRPAKSDRAQGEVILNATTRDAQDVSVYGARQFGGGWSGSVLSNYHRQSAQDLDDDGWIDMPEFERLAIRPRLFFEGRNGATLYLTAGVMSEDRRGGSQRGSIVPDGTSFQQRQDTQRVDTGAVYETPVADWGYAQVHASFTRQQHDHQFGSLLEVDEHDTSLIEATLGGEMAATSWVGGAAFQADDYRSETFSGFDYRYTSPALFAQVEHDISEQLSLAASARIDDHSEYSGQFSPRVSLLYHPGNWTIRGAWGRGFYAPTPFMEETEAAGLSRLQPLVDLDAETTETMSLDLGYASGAWETGLTVFRSEIDDAVRLEVLAPDRVRLANQQGITRTHGAEVLMRWRNAPYVVTASYLYIDAQEPTALNHRTVPLTPRHSAGIVAMLEQHGKGRLGLELYYTGTQALEDNPYRQESDPYLHVGLLGEIAIGRYRFFLNLENLLGVRQSKENPIVRPNRAPDGRWTVDAWSPLEGFIANAGVRIILGKQ